LELPFLGPVFDQFVLGHLDEDGVGSLFEVYGEAVLIDPGSAVVFLTGEDQFAIQPDFPTVFAAQAQLGWAGCVSVVFGERIADRALFGAEVRV
jgi:hypothetical protein